VVQHIISRYWPSVEQTMRQILDDYLADEPDFGVMLRYALGWVDENDLPYSKSTGKRLRPTFLLLCAEATGNDWKPALPAAASVEILHNFSLIHDDIQDVSDIRHGRPTVWRHWGTANAINAGDAMFAMAYSALSALSPAIPAARTLRSWQIFNATNLELTRGQHLDMRFEHLEEVSVEEYISMIRGKTAALLAASGQIGAYIVTGDEAKAQHYADFGMNLGIAFQIRDDILGIWGDAELLGKSISTDILSRKKSMPILHGLAQSEELKALYTKEPFGEADVEPVVQLLNNLGALEYAQAQEKHYYEAAVKALEQAQPQGEAADYLQEFVDFLFQRTY